MQQAKTQATTDLALATAASNQATHRFNDALADAADALERQTLAKQRLQTAKDMYDTANRDLTQAINNVRQTPFDGQSQIVDELFQAQAIVNNAQDQYARAVSIYNLLYQRAKAADANAGEMFKRATRQAEAVDNIEADLEQLNDRFEYYTSRIAAKQREAESARSRAARLLRDEVSANSQLRTLVAQSVQATADLDAAEAAYDKKLQAVKLRNGKQNFLKTLLTTTVDFKFTMALEVFRTVPGKAGFAAVIGLTIPGLNLLLENIAIGFSAPHPFCFPSGATGLLDWFAFTFGGQLGNTAPRPAFFAMGLLTVGGSFLGNPLKTISEVLSPLAGLRACRPCSKGLIAALALWYTLGGDEHPPNSTVIGMGGMPAPACEGRQGAAAAPMTQALAHPPTGRPKGVRGGDHIESHQYSLFLHTFPYRCKGIRSILQGGGVFRQETVSGGGFRFSDWCRKLPPESAIRTMSCSLGPACQAQSLC